MLKTIKKSVSFKLALIVVLILSFILYSSYLGNGFIWLDHGDIEQGRTILPPTKLYLAIITRFGDTGFYRPLVTILNSIDKALYGEDATGFHLTNVLLHLATVAIAPFFMAAFFTLLWWEFLLIAIVAAIHPISFLPVGAISYRPEILLTLFTFLTVIFYNKARETGKLLYIIFTFISATLALFSKETAIYLLPILILLLEIKNSNQLSAKKSLLFGLGSILLIYIFLRMLVVGTYWKVTPLSLPISEALGTRLFAFGKLLTYFIIPLKPPLSDATPIVGIFHPFVLITFSVLFMFIFLIFRFGIKSKNSLAIMLFLLFLIPSLNIVPLPRFTSSHYGYSALAAFAMLIVFSIRYIKRIPTVLQSVLLAGFIIWLVIAGISIHTAGYRFKNDYTLFSPEVEKDPYFMEGHFYLGYYYQTNGDLETAKKEYQYFIDPPKNVVAYTEQPSALINLAGVYLQEGNLDEADKTLQLASLIPSANDFQIAYNRAVIAFEQNNYEKVVQLLEKDGYYTKSPESYVLLMLSYAKLGREEEAKKLLDNIKPLLAEDQLKKLEEALHQETE